MDDVTTHLSADGLVLYRDRRLPPAELLAADDHLAICESCHQRLVQVPGLNEKVTAAAKSFDDALTVEVTHLTYEQLEALVDQQVDDIDRETLQSHLDLCPACETELNDLREVSLGRTKAARGRRISAPSMSARKETTWLFWRSPAYGLVTLALLGAVGLISFLISIPLRRENAQARARLAELEQSNAALQARVDALEGLQNEVAALQLERDRLRSLAESQARVALNDGGGRVILDAQGNLSGLANALRYEASVKEALISGRLRLPAALQELRGSSGTMMGSGQTRFTLLAPVGVIIESDRPRFRWSVLDGSTSYTVAIFDEASNRIATSDALAGTEWTPALPLVRGKAYIWQVRAVKNGEEVVAPEPGRPRARFRVLEHSKLDDIRRARESNPGSHLVLGVVYADAGLLQEAQREFSELVRANPQSTVAQKLLRNVSALLRRSH
jgi:hypothetical protein